MNRDHDWLPWAMVFVAMVAGTITVHLNGRLTEEIRQVELRERRLQSRLEACGEGDRTPAARTGPQLRRFERLDVPLSL